MKVTKGKEKGSTLESICGLQLSTETHGLLIMALLQNIFGSPSGRLTCTLHYTSMMYLSDETHLRKHFIYFCDD